MATTPMTEGWQATIQELVTIPGIAGLEDAMTRRMADEFNPYADAVTIDSMGNVIARFGKAGGPAVAVLAHMDTVGMMVRVDRGDGAYGVVPVGGINLKSLPGTAVWAGKARGVIGVRSQHQAKDGDGATSAEQLTVYAGTESLEITTAITYATDSFLVGEKLLSSPYLDNRAGCAVLLELARELKGKELPFTVYLIGTVQEETTCAGALHALRAVAPTAAIFVDGTVSYDTPESKGQGSVKLGSGPVLTAFLYVSGLNGWHADPVLRGHLIKTAQQAGLPYQQDATHGLMSDARVVTWLGIPSAVVGIPMRGKHSPQEMIHLDDVGNSIRLLMGVLQTPLPELRRGEIE